MYKWNVTTDSYMNELSGAEYQILQALTIQFYTASKAVITSSFKIIK